MVKPGDYLSAIASKHGVAGGWQALYALNRTVIGKNPNLIFPGQRLSLYNTPRKASTGWADGDLVVRPGLSSCPACSRGSALPMRRS